MTQHNDPSQDGLRAYLPQDRLRALARGEALPDRATGSALFADISGFTHLTEALREDLGPRRGAEALTSHLDAVYTALIDEIERCGGSVIGFAGDAITCWFSDSDGPAAPRAVASAFALQTAMRAFASIGLPNDKQAALTVKVAVATGAARRFAIGDPGAYLLDVLAGATVTRTAMAERLARRGEVLVDEATASALGSALTVVEWREAREAGQGFAVAAAATSDVAAPPQAGGLIDTEALRPWIHPAVFERAGSNQGAFLTEFRPCVAVFVRFEGIDYDSDSAEGELGAFIQGAQRIAAGHGGTLMDVTIGDKGSYLYLNVGALSAHEDDARRALKIALELRSATRLTTQVGITQGTMRVGAIGGRKRRAYGALGDDVNLAARLMETAAPGEILLSGRAHKAVGDDYVFEPRPPLAVKGKAEPLPVFAVTGERQHRAIRLQEPTYGLPMVGRQRELEVINGILDLALGGQSQIIGIVGDAGMGKSRLVAEVIRSARKKGFAGYGGGCQSDGVKTPYQAWKTIWSALFDVDPSAALRKQIRLLEGEIEERAPRRLEAVPLLGPLLNLAIPDNDFTQALEPKGRQSALHALLEECLRATAKDEPLLIVIEDLHWIDALSYELLDQLARATAGCPIVYLLAYRPPQPARLDDLPRFSRVSLSELSAADGEQVIRAKMAQLYPARSGAVPAALAKALMARAQGNPFYLEELLNFLRDRGLDPREPGELNRIELPDSLHTLILSRIDRLSERERITLRVASIIGRFFRAAWLTGYYPALGAPQQVKTDLDILGALDITPLDTPEPILAYLFKHIVTHEVTYASLPFATRAQLHEQLAGYLEGIAAPLETIAHHYGHSQKHAKTLEYATRAGDAAFRVYATTEAVAQYGLAIEAARRIEAETGPAPDFGAPLAHLYGNRGRALELSGNYGDALANYAAMEAHARDRVDRALELSSLVAQATLRSTPTAVSDQALGRALCEKALALAQDLGDRRTRATILRTLMLLNNFSGFLPEAVQYGEDALALARELGLREQAAFILNDLFRSYASVGDYQRAQTATEEARLFWRETGNKPMLADNLGRSARVAWALGDFEGALAYSTEARQVSQSIGNLWGMSFSVMFVSYVHLERGDPITAIETMKDCIQLADEAGFGLAQIATRADLGWVYGTLGAVDMGLDLARAARARAEQRMPAFRTWALACLARLCVMGGRLEEAETAIKEGRAAFTADFAQHGLIELPLAEAELAMAKGDHMRAIGAVDALLARLGATRIRTFVSEALHLKGRALLGLGRLDEALEVLQAAQAEAEALGSRRMAWQILLSLSDIEERRGATAGAQALRERAREIVEGIAARTPDDLRARFLDLPRVRALWAATGAP